MPKCKQYWTANEGVLKKKMVLNTKNPTEKLFPKLLRTIWIHLLK